MFIHIMWCHTRPWIGEIRIFSFDSAWIWGWTQSINTKHSPKYLISQLNTKFHGGYPLNRLLKTESWLRFLELNRRLRLKRKLGSWFYLWRKLDQTKRRIRHGCLTSCKIALNNASVCDQVNTELSQIRNRIGKLMEFKK